MKGYSIHVGVNRISETHYEKNYDPLTAPVWDAERMRFIADKEGFIPIATLLNEAATRENFFSKIELSSSRMTDEDTLMITFSGHGSSFRDSKNPRDYKIVQAICLYDWMLREDELLIVLDGLFNSKQKIIFISDSCHSGGFLETEDTLDIEPDKQPSLTQESIKPTPEDHLGQKAKSLPEKHFENIFSRKIYQDKWKDLGIDDIDNQPQNDLTINHLAACLQKEEALEREAEYSFFTEALYRVWNMSRHSYIDYESFTNDIKIHLQTLNPVQKQSPNFKQLGTPNTEFILSRPF
ncbi:caspase family protein [Flammeovirgaceae bacterium SG7u.111]|nr:caspase family protein [Flammeovirgaceae bacterium SG7u.132]WPO37149.1 caspase family protein [Flammeovirgaceae bacterium SG7u.111]